MELPTKDDLLTQIRGDMNTSTENNEVLTERQKVVEEALNDQLARDVYERHVRDSQEPSEDQEEEA